MLPIIIEFYNKCHDSGGPGGGQFCSTGAPGTQIPVGSSTVAVRKLLISKGLDVTSVSKTSAKSWTVKFGDGSTRKVTRSTNIDELSGGAPKKSSTKEDAPERPVSKKGSSSKTTTAPPKKNKKTMSERELLATVINASYKVDDLPSGMRSVHARYIEDGFLAINAAMRGTYDAGTQRQGAPYVGRLKKVFDQASVELDGDATLFRGMNLSKDDVDDMFKEGGEFVDKGFISTTYMEGTTKGFRKRDKDATGETVPVLMRINAPKGTRFLSGNPAEGEMILAPETKFKVSRVERTDTGVIVHVDIVESPKPPLANGTVKGKASSRKKAAKTTA